MCHDGPFPAIPSRHGALQPSMFIGGDDGQAVHLPAQDPFLFIEPAHKAGPLLIFHLVKGKSGHLVLCLFKVLDSSRPSDGDSGADIEDEAVLGFQVLQFLAQPVEFKVRHARVLPIVVSFRCFGKPFRQPRLFPLLSVLVKVVFLELCDLHVPPSPRLSVVMATGPFRWRVMAYCFFLMPPLFTVPVCEKG